MLKEFLNLIDWVSKFEDFGEASLELEKFIGKANKKEIIELVNIAGTIPESIQPSSSEEKVFSKSGDIISACALKYLGLRAKSIGTRGNAGDVIAKSIEYNYSLIGDAKSFRLSRTAKNQKDFKIKALSQWREDNNYAVLIGPLFQYPTKKSQIYKQSIDENVLLFSWEHLAILLKLDIVENATKTFEQLWNFPQKYSKKITVADSEKNFFKDFNSYFLNEFKLSKEELSGLLEQEIVNISDRADLEKKYWKERAARIKKYSKEEAIRELLAQINIDSKIRVIDGYVGGLNRAKIEYVD